MHTADAIVFAANGGLAAVALGVNWWAAREDDPRRRPLRAAIGGFAALYLMGYVWVLVTENVVMWSRAFRGVSIIVWPLVWCAPAVTGVVLHKRDRQRLLDHAKAPG